MGPSKSTIGLALAVPLLLSGCNSLGPQAISNGRILYNDVVNRTEDEEVLRMVVRLRYGESFGHLTVSNITANIRVTASAGAQLGIGPDESFAGNLIPLSGGIAYEENPTISYVPHSGESFVRRLLMPLSLDMVVLFGRSMRHSETVLQVIVRRINGLRNPLGGDPAEAADFDRAIELLVRLRSEDMLDLGLLHAGKPDLGISIFGYAEKRDAVAELMTLLDLPAPPEDGRDIVLPILTAMAHQGSTALNVEMRSIYEVLQLFGGSIDIPQDHIDRGIVDAWQGHVPAAAREFRVRSSLERPSNAAVATQVHGAWFYIDETDLVSKRSFVLFRAMVGMQLDSGLRPQHTPFLTVPVSD